MAVLRFLLRNMRQHRAVFVIIFSIAFIDGIGVFVIPVLLGQFTTVKLDSFPLLLGTIIGIYVVGLGLQWSIRRYGESSAIRTETESLIRLYQEYERVPIGKLANHHSGQVLTLMNRLSDGGIPLIMDAMWSTTRSIPQIILFFYFTARSSWPLAAANIVLFILFFVFGTVLSKGQVPLGKAYNVTRAAFMERFVDFLTNMHTVRKLGLTRYTETVLAGKTDAVSDKVITLQKYHAKRWFLLHLVSGVVFIGTLGTIAWRVGHGLLPVSLLVIFVAAYLFIRGTIDRATENIRRLMAYHAYLQNLREILDQSVQPTGRVVTEWQTVRFQQVTFQYDQQPATITIPSFEIHRGDRICIVGKSGEGKSTFLNIVAGFLEPSAGMCTIDSQPFDQLNLISWQEHIAFVSQEVEVFNTTLRENLALGQPVDDQHIHELLAEVDLADWVTTLPNGLDTIVGEKGVRLSSGQKQRLNIIRGILLDRDLYLLDEPISHLDTNTAERVIACLQHHLAQKTLLVVTHHDSLRELCTRAFRVRNHTLEPEA